jgi:hypothetical protein
MLELFCWTCLRKPYIWPPDHLNEVYELRPIDLNFANFKLVVV